MAVGVEPTPQPPVEALQARLGYAFRDPALLEEALTHPSFLQGLPGSVSSNQRLEFLGDSVLQLILTQMLFSLYPGEREGPLSRRRAVLAKGPFLARLALETGLAGCLRMGAAEEASGGRAKSAALEDAFEALVGALYLDSDLATVRRVLEAVYGDLPSRLAKLETGENPKGRLQELIQPEHGNQALRYEVVAVEGADHARAYAVSVLLNGKPLGSGRGPSKKAAEEEAARQALLTLARG